MYRSLSIALLAAVVLLPLAGAQVRIAATGPSAGPSYGIASSPVRGSGFHARGGQRVPRSPLFLGDPYLYSDDFSTPVVAEPPAPQVVVMQAPPAVEVAKEPRPEPLLIEWQGDRYVRINADRTARQGYAPADYVEAKPPSRTGVKKTAAANTLAPAALVFRDGHQEEIRDYTIADGIIYARGDYWIDGYWNKKIQLSVLDLPATMKASQEHGVTFVLPASPNEVIVRP
jgi:hypothetical protein